MIRTNARGRRDRQHERLMPWSKKKQNMSLIDQICVSIHSCTGTVMECACVRNAQVSQPRRK